MYRKYSYRLDMITQKQNQNQSKKQRKKQNKKQNKKQSKKQSKKQCHFVFGFEEFCITENSVFGGTIHPLESSCFSDIPFVLDVYAYIYSLPVVCSWLIKLQNGR